MAGTVYYNGQEYSQRSANEGLAGYFLASAASGAVLAPAAIPSYFAQKQLLKEQINNAQYKDAFIKAHESSGLKAKGVKIIEAQKEFGSNAFIKGQNAAYIHSPAGNVVYINTDKISCAGFHELGHAMNNLMSKYGVKYLQKARKPCYAIAALMEYFAIFSRTKPKGAPRSFTDVIEDNCGKIAFFAMLPVVAEEAIASYRGYNLAKKAGLSKTLLKNVKKMQGTALSTYIAGAALGGLAVYTSRKIMDSFTRPKPAENRYYWG